MQKCHIISANVTNKQYWRRNFILLSLTNCKSEFKLCVVFVCALLTSVLPSIFLGLVILLITSTHGHKKKCKNFRPAFGLANCKNEAKLCLMFVRFWLPCPPGSPLPILLPPSGDKSHLNWPSCHHDGATGGRRRKLGMRHRYTYCSAPKCKKAKITSRIKGFSETKNRTTLLNQITRN